MHDPSEQSTSASDSSGSTAASSTSQDSHYSAYTSSGQDSQVGARQDSQTSERHESGICCGTDKDRVGELGCWSMALLSNRRVVVLFRPTTNMAAAHPPTRLHSC